MRGIPSSAPICGVRHWSLLGALHSTERQLMRTKIGDGPKGDGQGISGPLPPAEQHPGAAGWKVNGLFHSQTWILPCNNNNNWAGFKWSLVRDEILKSVCFEVSYVAVLLKNSPGNLQPWPGGSKLQRLSWNVTLMLSGLFVSVLIIKLGVAT